MKKWWDNLLMVSGRSPAGLSMASLKGKLLLWAGFISNGQCFAGEAMEGKCWLVESEEAAPKAAFDGHGW